MSSGSQCLELAHAELDDDRRLAPFLGRCLRAGNSVHDVMIVIFDLVDDESFLIGLPDEMRERIDILVQVGESMRAPVFDGLVKRLVVFFERGGDTDRGKGLEGIDAIS